MVKWITGCAQLLTPDPSTGDRAGHSLLPPAMRSERFAAARERMIAAGAFLGLVAVLALAFSH